MRFGVVEGEVATAARSGAGWARLGNVTALWGDDAEWTAVTANVRQPVAEHPGSVVSGHLHLVRQVGRSFQRAHPDVEVLLDKGRYLVVALPPAEAATLSGEDVCVDVRPLRAGTVAFTSATPAARTPVPWVQALVDAVSPSRLRATVTHLASYPTRHSLSGHHEAAVAWARGVLDALGYTTRIDAVTLAGGPTRNLVADRPGAAGAPRDLVLVVAHLDSINQAGGPSGQAPGADDNGSGAAGVLEIARLLATHDAAADLRLILFGGEEQGLHGSRQYVAALPAAERERLRAVVNMDMIATRNTLAPTVLVEGAAVSSDLMEALSSAAATYTSLDVQTSLDPFASDHVPFIEADLPAVLTIEGADRSNANVHTAGDTVDHVDDDLCTQIVGMNVAAVATALGRKGTAVSTIPRPDLSVELPLLDRPIPFEVWRPWLRLSGKYVYGSGASVREAASDGAGDPNRDLAVSIDPSIVLDRPLYLPQPHYPIELLRRLRFTLRIDVDGTDPLGVVSGTVALGLYRFGTAPPHFIGRVTSNTVAGGVRNLVVEEFALTWPGTSRTVDRLEVTLSGQLTGVTAEVTFVATAAGTRYGPYTVPRQSPWFREVEVEVDLEAGAADDVEPYDTHTHPDRPADLPRERLTLESVFAKSGVQVTRSPGSGTVVDTSEAGPDSRWSNQELHDAMERHWSRFANVAQWKMWVFLARLGASDGLGGIMFDGNINEPGGVDRQGTAVFTDAPFFHTATGGFPVANPPAGEAATRELFFNLIHEAGHAFNLAHSFQKTMGTPWEAPAWMPMASDAEALSWMNYPDRPTPGANATWFYERFRFRFSDGENLFLRHAPESFVQMGNTDWFVNHGRVAQGTLDRRLELVLRTRSESVAFGETVFVELRLRNAGGEPVVAVTDLDPSSGPVELAVTGPDGTRRPFVPPVQARAAVPVEVLEPDARRYADVALTVGMFGFPFKQPGHYRVEAAYHNADGGTAAAVLHVFVEPPGSYEDERTVRSLFDAPTGLTLTVGGTRVLEDVNAKLDWAVDRLGTEHPAAWYLEAVRVLPLAEPFKAVEPGEDRVRVLDPDPEAVVEGLQPFVEHPEEAADAVGHIAFREIVDVLTDSAEEAGQRNVAREAQRTMLGLFERRAVTEPVVEEVRSRAERLR